MSSVWIGARNVTKGEQKELKLEIGLPSEGFPKTLYFNRFRVEREGEVCLLQFGLVSESTLLGSYTCAFPQEALHRESEVPPRLPEQDRPPYNLSDGVERRSG